MQLAWLRLFLCTIGMVPVSWYNHAVCSQNKRKQTNCTQNCTHRVEVWFFYWGGAVFMYLRAADIITSTRTQLHQLLLKWTLTIRSRKRNHTDCTNSVRVWLYCVHNHWRCTQVDQKSYQYLSVIITAAPKSRRNHSGCIRKGLDGRRS